MNDEIEQFYCRPLPFYDQKTIQNFADSLASLFLNEAVFATCKFSVTVKTIEPVLLATPEFTVI